RVRYQMLLVPQEPLRLGADGTLRVRIVHFSEVKGVGIVNFRVSVTSSPKPKFMLDMKASLRPLLNIPVEKRTPEKDAALTAHCRTVDVELQRVREKIAEHRNRIEDLQIPSTLIMAEDSAIQHPTTNIRMRG